MIEVYSGDNAYVFDHLCEHGRVARVFTDMTTFHCQSTRNLTWRALFVMTTMCLNAIVVAFGFSSFQIKSK